MPSLTPVAIRHLTVLALCAALGGCVGRPEAVPPASGARTGAPVERAAAPASFRAADVLRSWDRARARAYAAGDASALRRLYADGSAAGRADVRMLRRYLRRGLVVTGMQVQLLGIDVLLESPHRLRLRVTDRLVGAEAVGRDGAAIRLPRDGVSTRMVELVREDEASRWRVAGVRESAPPRDGR